MDELKKEQRLLLLLSRLTITDNEKKEIQILANSKDFNWFEFVKYALYHRTGALCWKNMHKLMINSYIPDYLDDNLGYIYQGNKRRNAYMMDEKELVVDALKQSGVSVIPVKGSMLIPMLYQDYGMRYSSDFDLLVKFDDLSKIPDVMVQLGYEQGVFDRNNMEVIPAKKKTVLKHKMFLSNEHPYVKPSGTDVFMSFGVDFRFALGYERKCAPINDMIQCFEDKGCVPDSYYLLHLCVHFYEEAKQGVDILLGKDINMIKLCDIREYILRNKVRKEEFIELCFKYELREEIYLALYYLKMVYGDGYEDEWMESLRIENDDFLNNYGTRIKEENVVFKKGFWERFFSCCNLDEIDAIDAIAEQL